MINETMTYRGKTVATISTVTRIGLNFEVEFTNGYRVVVPVGMLSETVQAKWL